MTKSATSSVDSIYSIFWLLILLCIKVSVDSVDSFRFAKKKKGKQKVLSLQKVNQRREVNYCVI